MKNLILINLIFLLPILCMGQTNDTIIVNNEIIENESNDSDTTIVKIAGYKIIVIDSDSNENVQIKRDENSIIVIENNDSDINRNINTNTNTNTNTNDDNDNDNDDDDDDESVKKKKFKTRTNWGGLSYGLLSLASSSIIQPGSEDFINLESGSSWAWEFLSISVPVGSPYISLTTGLGYRRDKYQLNDNYRALSDNERVFGEITDITFDKNVLKHYYLEIPLMLNISTSKYKKSNLKFSVGYIQQIGLRSKAEYEYSINGSKQKEEVKDNFHFRKYNGKVTARIGYRGFTFYGNYGLDSIFESKKGPALDPLTIGLSIRIVPVLRWSAKYHS